MCVVYGKRAVGPASPLTEALREELYCAPYESLQWSSARFHCCPADLFYPHPWIQDALWNVLYYAGEPLLQGSWLRGKAIEECMALIHYEDYSTRYVDIGPVNKALNMLACYFEDPASDAFKRCGKLCKDV
jgi:cycloartenol synthase